METGHGVGVLLGVETEFLGDDGFEDEMEQRDEPRQSSPDKESISPYPGAQEARPIAVEEGVKHPGTGDY